MVGDITVERPWLYDKSYEFWLSLGTAETAHPDYTCLNCINEALDFINVVVPRRLIIATQNSGAHFYGNYSAIGYFLGGEVGLAFIKHIRDNYDYSFLVPIMYASDQTHLIDELNREIIRNPHSTKSLLNNIKKSETHRQALSTLINTKSTDCFAQNKTPLKRARHWRHIASSDSDYTTPMPLFWYTSEDDEFILDYGLPFRMQLRTLLHRPSLAEVFSAPLSIMALLGYYAYRAVRLSIRKAGKSNQS